MDVERSGPQASERTWLRLPNGTKVRHREEGYEGIIDGVTEIVDKGAILNPDHKSQYRVHVGEPQRKLAGEDELLIMSDREGLMMIGKQPAGYRKQVTEWFRSRYSEEKFVG